MEPQRMCPIGTEARGKTSHIRSSTQEDKKESKDSPFLLTVSIPSALHCLNPRESQLKGARESKPPSPPHPPPKGNWTPLVYQAVPRMGKEWIWRQRGPGPTSTMTLTVCNYLRKFKERGEKSTYQSKMSKNQQQTNPNIFFFLLSKLLIIWVSICILD